MHRNGVPSILAQLLVLINLVVCVGDVPEYRTVSGTYYCTSTVVGTAYRRYWVPELVPVLLRATGRYRTDSNTVPRPGREVPARYRAAIPHDVNLHHGRRPPAPRLRGRAPGRYAGYGGTRPAAGAPQLPASRANRCNERPSPSLLRWLPGHCSNRPESDDGRRSAATSCAACVQRSCIAIAHWVVRVDSSCDRLPGSRWQTTPQMQELFGHGGGARATSGHRAGASAFPGRVCPP